MNLMFLGPPGAGKGTVASRLSAELGIPQISTGDIIRAAIRNATPLGLKVKEIVEGGKLVPDDLTNELVRDRLTQSDCRSGFILDGFPRTIGQAEALESMTKLKKVVNFEIIDNVLVERLSGRLVHKASGRTYHIKFNPPKKAGIDDLTGEPLIKRPDDEESAIKTRLEVYHAQTAPLIEYYKKTGLLASVNALDGIDEVYAAVQKVIK